MRRAAIAILLMLIPPSAWAAGACSTSGTGSALKKAADGLGATDWFAKTAP